MELVLRRMNGRPGSVWRLLTNLLVLIHQASFLVQGQSFNYPTFTSTDKLLLDRDAQFMPDTSSAWLNPSYNGSDDGLNYSCGSLIYAESIQMRETPLNNATDSAGASFNTSFTFSMIGKNSAGFAFMFVPNNHTTGEPGGQLCLVNKLHPDDNKVLAVEFDTWQNPEFNDSSSDHVGVNINSVISTAFYDLCGEGFQSTCSYFVTAQDFTAWIDYDSASQSLEVFLAIGSTIQGVSKPANAIIRVPHLDLSNVVNDHMFVGFSGSGAMFREVKKIKSWSFRTSILQPGQGPTSAPSKKLNVGRMVGVIVSGLVGGMVAIGIGYKLFKVFGRPLHFFLSHAGGEHQEGKNFPDRLYDELNSSWKLKYFIKVFMDRRCLPKGKPFSEQINLELEKTEVGVVFVTEEFFTREWPMTELVTFVKSQEKNPAAVRILPLFYKMTTGEVSDHLRQGIWDEAWTQMSWIDNPRIPVEECRKAVKKLCGTNGIEYDGPNRGHDTKYIKVILKEVGKILREEKWKR